MIDRYTKTILTIIAAALVALVVQPAVPSAVALERDCGSIMRPCAVFNVLRDPGRFTNCAELLDRPCFAVRNLQ
jgi:hypothetical protein